MQMPMSAARDKSKTPSPPVGLQVVGTPIGNLEDVTLRALRILGEADLIAAEDTRRTRKLLTHYDIHTPLISYHEHNKHAKTPGLIEKLKGGAVVALVSDAGMPGISDPGHDLIKSAIEQNIPISIVPGPSSISSALVLSGLTTDEFHFAGFLPRKKGERTRRLISLLECDATLVLFEAPNRVLSLLEAIAEITPQRHVAVARELTKKFEQVVRASASEAVAYFSEHEPRGEFVVVVEACGEAGEIIQKPEASAPKDIGAYVEKAMREEGLSKKEAMRKAAKEMNISRRDVYKALLETDGT
jgi:16S rRNA (cytidine1402-2'-O)-methyltransferase